MNVPKLRFPNFTDEWERKTINDIFDRVGEPVDVKEGEKYREIGIRSHGKGLFYKDETDINELGNKRVYWIEPDCFILNIVFAWERAVARTTQSEVGMIASHRFPMYKPKDGVVDLDYITTYFKTKQGQQIMILASPGGAGRNKTLGQKDFANSVIPLPSYEEQLKITEFFTELDNMIKLAESEVLELEKQKKAVMQKIFSQEVRFKRADGSNYPDWETHPLNYYLYENKDRNKALKYTKHDVVSVSKDYGVVNQIEYLGKSMAGNDLSNYHCVYEGDVIYTKSPLGKQPYGIIKGSNREGICSTLYAVYHCYPNAMAGFVDCYFCRDEVLNKYLKPLVNIGAKHDMKVHNDVAISGNVTFPCLDEQQRIVEFLHSFDVAIEYSRQELDKWKLLKEGFLQQMFV